MWPFESVNSQASQGEDVHLKFPLSCQDVFLHILRCMGKREGAHEQQTDTGVPGFPSPLSWINKFRLGSIESMSFETPRLIPLWAHVFWFVLVRLVWSWVLRLVGNPRFENWEWDCSAACLSCSWARARVCVCVCLWCGSHPCKIHFPLECHPCGGMSNSPDRKRGFTAYHDHLLSCYHLSFLSLPRRQGTRAVFGLLFKYGELSRRKSPLLNPPPWVWCRIPATVSVCCSTAPILICLLKASLCKENQICASLTCLASCPKC